MENVDKTQEERDPVSAAESFSREKPAAPAADAAAAPSLTGKQRPVSTLKKMRLMR